MFFFKYLSGCLRIKDPEAPQKVRRYKKNPEVLQKDPDILKKIWRLQLRSEHNKKIWRPHKKSGGITKNLDFQEKDPEVPQNIQTSYKKIRTSQSRSRRPKKDPVIINKIQTSKNKISGGPTKKPNVLQKDRNITKKRSGRHKTLCFMTSGRD